MRKRKHKNSPDKSCKKPGGPDEKPDEAEHVLSSTTESISGRSTPSLSPCRLSLAPSQPSLSPVPGPSHAFRPVDPDNQPLVTSPSPLPTSGTTSNRFHLLQSSQPSTLPPSSARQDLKPPLIFFHHVANFTTFTTTLRQTVGDNFSCRVRGNAISVQLTTSDQWRTLSRHCLDHGLQFYTHSPKEEKPFRIVIRHLHHSTPLDFIKSDLAAKGHSCLNAINIKGRNNEPRPLFFVDLEQKPNNKEIFHLTSLCFCIIKVEEPHPNKPVVQCKRCQLPGHTRNWCNLPPRCVKCAGQHDTSMCPGPKIRPPEELTCVLCEDKGHTASWRGCPVHKKFANKNLPHTTSTNRPSPSQTSTNVQPGVSYSSVLSSNPSRTTFPPLNPPCVIPLVSSTIPSPPISSTHPLTTPSPPSIPSSPSIPSPPTIPTTPHIHLSPPLSPPHPTPASSFQTSSNTPTPQILPSELLTSLSSLVVQIQQMVSPLVSVLSQLAASLSSFQTQPC